MRRTPRCHRGLHCQALHEVRSDDSTTFICCGLNFRDGDSYTVCMISEDTDTRFDYNKLDLLDTIEVLARALSTEIRI